MADSLQIIISLILLRNDNISLAKYLTVSVLQMQCTRKVNLCGKCPQPKLLTAFKGKLLWKLLEGCLLLLHLFQVRRQHRYQCLSKWGEILAQIDPFPPLLQYIWIRYLIVYITKKIYVIHTCRRGSKYVWEPLYEVIASYEVTGLVGIKLFLQKKI